MFHFFSSMIDKIESSLHSVGEMVGIYPHSKEDPASWKEVLEEVKDLPGVELMLNLALTLTSFEENFY